MVLKNSFNYRDFFDVSEFSHQALFYETEQIWEVLKNIAPYLKNRSLGNIEGIIDPRAYLIDEHLISIGKNSIVEPGAYIKGPCIIGENCVIRHGAYIRGDVITGNGCVIGHDTEVKNSLFLNKVHAAHFAYLGDCILGNHVNLGAGSKCANLKFDQSTIQVDKMDTGLRKFGAILADEVQLGCNCVTCPGTIIGKQSYCYPNTTVRGIIPQKHVVKSANHVTIDPLW